MAEIAEQLAEIERLGLGRRLRMVNGPQGATVVLDGKPVLLLCSNNYLGLADHPRVRQAAADAAMRWGAGAGASRLVSGTMTIHRRLEERLAEFERTEACVLFGSGYLANMGVLGALAGAGDTIFSDELNHASIIDGCRLARAEVFVYRHRDLEHLEWGLARRGRGRPVIVSDTVFSMDGDVAPLAELCELAGAYGARLVVDEAHATGALGPGGRGAVAEAGVEDAVDVVVGTLGKALGSYGAYACASAEMVRYLINVARPLIFSTAPPPPAVAGALAALDLLEERPHRVQRLRANARALRAALAGEGFPVEASTMHVVPLIAGAEQAATRMCQEALEQGVFAQAIRPPTVPAGGARLRVTAMASHTQSELEMAAGILGRAARRAGLEPESFAASAPERVGWPETDEAGPLEREAGAVAGAPFELHRTGPAPFDLERDAPGPFDLELEGTLPREHEGAPGAAAARDQHTAAFDVEAALAAEAESRPDAGAPFDIERELASAQAA
jgi:glycine C-acetyltransferase/8-amino-7-oxononanoate synthase